MAALLQAGLLAVLLTAVTAELEYTTEMAITLVDYQNLVEHGVKSMNYTPINPTTKVLLNRMKLPESGGALHFYVRPHPDEAGSNGKNVSLPGIRIALKKCMKPCLTHCCSSQKDNPLQDFEFREMHFLIKPNRNLKPYMKLTVEFYDSKNDQAIEVVMQLFKPPTNKADEEHAKKRNVPTLSPPISLEELSTGNKARAKYGKQNFVVDISWMNAVLQRAKFDGTKDGDLTTKYTEIYLAGPVIINREAYNKILELEPAYLKYTLNKQN